VDTKPTQNGKFSKSVSVETDAPEARSFRLRFSADVEAAVIATPAMRFVLSAVEGEPAESRILLHRTDGKALEVGVDGTGNPALSVRTEVVSKATKKDRVQAEPGDVWLVLATKADQRAVNSNGSLKVTTNQPDLPTLTIPFTVRVRPLIELRPATAQLWFGQENTGRRQTIVTLTGYQDRKFKITGVDVSNPELFSARADSQDSSTRHRLWIILADGATASAANEKVKGFVRIHTDLPGRKELNLPVLVESRKPAGPRTVYGRPTNAGSH